MISLKKRLSKIGLTGFDVSAFHPLYRSRRDAFPYRSLRQLLTSFDWPGGYVGGDSDANDYPAEKKWANDLQGVANDGRFWYFTRSDDNTSEIWRLPFNHDLENPFNTDKTWSCLGDDFNVTEFGRLRPVSEFSAVFNHLGSPGYFNGHLYLPWEGPNSATAFQLLQVSANGVTGRKGWTVTSMEHGLEQKQAPWCAINPVNGLLYSSGWPLSDRPEKQAGLFVYKPNINQDKLSLEYLGQFQLFDESGRPWGCEHPQGGVFSPQGHFYIVDDYYYYEGRNFELRSPESTVSNDEHDVQTYLNEMDAYLRVKRKLENKPGVRILDQQGDSRREVTRYWLPPEGGILGFDMTTGRLKIHINIEYTPFLDVPVWSKYSCGFPMVIF